jgi:radical SAM-linked protein
MLARACARAQLPVRYSEGFNPHPRISLPVPRPVGVASDAERMVVELTEPVAPERIRRSLAEQVPEGVAMRQVRTLAVRERCLPRLVRYSVDIRDRDGDALSREASRMLASDSIPYDRYVHKESRNKTIDLRPFLEAIDVGDECVRFGLFVTGAGTAKPAEVCDILGIGGENVNHLIRRLEIEWQPSPA